MQEKAALLLRLSPAEWPNWEEYLAREPVQEFLTGRQRPEDIYPGIPVIVLGTMDSGIIGQGETVSGVRSISDPHWEQADRDYEEKYREAKNRVRVRVELDPVPIAVVKSHPLTVDLIRRRETTTWLTLEQFEACRSLMSA